MIEKQSQDDKYLLQAPYPAWVQFHKATFQHCCNNILLAGT